MIIGGLWNKVSKLNPTTIIYQGNETNYNEEMLKVDQSRLPFDIFLASIKPFDRLELDYNYSFAGMKIHFSRNSFGLLIGSYYGPTVVFSMLSLVSYSIRTDIVRQL